MVNLRPRLPRRVKEGSGDESESSASDWDEDYEGVVDDDEISAEITAPRDHKGKRQKTGRESQTKTEDVRSDRLRKRRKVVEDESDKIHPAEIFVFLQSSRSKTQLDEAVSFWFDRLETDERGTYARLVHLIVEASGLDLESEAFAFKESFLGRASRTADFVRELDRAGATMDEPMYPLIRRSSFHTLFPRFVEGVMSMLCSKEEGARLSSFLELFVPTLVSLSKAKHRGMRHATTVFFISLIDATTAGGNSVRDQISVLQRQLEGRTQKRRSATQAKGLHDQLEAFHVHLSRIEGLADAAFDGIFPHRYRDSAELVRRLCMQALGNWILAYPSKFLQNEYLKYFGWMMNDQKGTVRAATLKALTAVYEVDENIQPLQSFTGRFVNRIVEMCDDVDARTAARAIECSTVFLRRELLPSGVMTHLLELSEDSSEDVQHACAGLLAEHLSASLVLDGRTETDRFSRCDVRVRGNVEGQIIDLVRKAALVQSISRFVRLVMEKKKGDNLVLYQWEVMASLLTNDDARLEETVRGKNLDSVLLCVLVEAATISSQIDEDAKETVSAELIPLFSRLVARMGSRVADLVQLCALPLIFSLTVYHTRNYGDHFSELCESLTTVVLRHCDPELLSVTGRVFDYICVGEHPLQGRANAAVVSLLRTVYDRFTDSLRTVSEEVMEEERLERSFVVLEMLQRLHWLGVHVDLCMPGAQGAFDVETAMVSLVSQFVGGRDVDIEVCSHSLAVLVLRLWWKVFHVGEDGAEMKEKRDQIVKLCIDCLDFDMTRMSDEMDSLRVSALDFLFDTLQLKVPGADVASVQEAVFSFVGKYVDAGGSHDAMQSICVTFSKFVVHSIFVDCQADFLRLFRRCLGRFRTRDEALEFAKKAFGFIFPDRRSKRPEIVHDTLVCLESKKFNWKELAVISDSPESISSFSASSDGLVRVDLREETSE